MTREEAIIILDCERPYGNCGCGASVEEIEDALNMAIQALEQEPCDAISRQSAIFLASDLKHDLPDDESIADMVMAHNEGILEYQTQLSLLPSVRPQEQTGHWINMKISINGDMSAECDKCGCIVRNSFTNNAINYCPNCGARMVEPQERSNKE